MTNPSGFDFFANEYDSWIANNQPLLESEVQLLAHIWPDSRPARILSPPMDKSLTNSS